MSFHCETCSKKFTTNTKRNRHLRTTHKILSTTRKKNFKCLECDDAYYDSNIKLIDHLKTSHGKEFEDVEFTVSTMSEFEEWKKEMEKNSISYYIMKYKTENRSLFYCNRSLNKRESRRAQEKLYKRREKSQGSCKMEMNCTSYIKLRKSNERDEIKVFFQKTHYGHTPQLQHIRLPIEDKIFVASKLINGVPPTKILQTVGASIGVHPNRMNLLTAKDIENIKNSFHIENGIGPRQKRRTIHPYNNLVTGKATKQMRVNFERHKKAMTSTYDIVESDGVLQVTTKSSKLYEVKKLNNLKCCQNICRICQVCRHMFTCTCPDFERSNAVCKHIHYAVFHEERLAPSTSSNSAMVESTLVQQSRLCRQSIDDNDIQTRFDKKKTAIITELLKNIKTADYETEVVKEMESCMS